MTPNRRRPVELLDPLPPAAPAGGTALQPPVEDQQTREVTIPSSPLAPSRRTIKPTILVHDCLHLMLGPVPIVSPYFHLTGGNDPCQKLLRQWRWVNPAITPCSRPTERISFSGSRVPAEGGVPNSGAVPNGKQGLSRLFQEYHSALNAASKSTHRFAPNRFEFVMPCQTAVRSRFPGSPPSCANQTRVAESGERQVPWCGRRKISREPNNSEAHIRH